MIITKTPLRISFLGGNTDFAEYYKKYGGAVLTTAIDKFIYCIVKKRFDDMIYINYSIKEKVTKVEDIKHDLVREAMNMVGIVNGIEITFLSDIPAEGSGLGSSSAVTVGLLNALYQYIGVSMPLGQLASKACRIEIDILKKPIGIQDQIITAYGGFRYLRLLSETQVETLKVNMNHETSDKLQASLMMFYTNQTRSADKILKKMNIKKNKEILDKNKHLAVLGNQSLELGQFVAIGELMDNYWDLKKKLNNDVTNPEIDKMYKKAKKAGAIGGKILGAGGGGFMLLMVDPSNQQKVREALKGHNELKFNFEPYGTRSIFNIQE